LILLCNSQFLKIIVIERSIYIMLKYDAFKLRKL